MCGVSQIIGFSSSSTTKNRLCEWRYCVRVILYLQASHSKVRFNINMYDGVMAAAHSNTIYSIANVDSLLEGFSLAERKARFRGGSPLDGVVKAGAFPRT